VTMVFTPIGASAPRRTHLYPGLILNYISRHHILTHNRYSSINTVSMTLRFPVLVLDKVKSSIHVLLLLVAFTIESNIVLRYIVIHIVLGVFFLGGGG
jgi:hypothetical protein